MEFDSSKLPVFQCHKRVRAGQIRAYEIDQDGVKATIWLDDLPGMVISAGVFARGRPSPGDYFVVYDDGYQSWSPRAAFEDGYLIEELPNEPAQQGSARV